MKTDREIADSKGFDRKDFKEFIRHSTIFKTEIGNGDIEIFDRDVEQVINSYIKFSPEKIEQKKIKDEVDAEEKKRKQKADAEEKERKQKADAIKTNALANMLITSGFNFDGYTITKYSGYISGDDAIQIPRGMHSIFGGATNVGDALMSSLVKIRRKAIMELKEAAYDLGCNAVIGVDFDYLTLDPQTANIGGGTTYLPYVFGVTANGNAVVIEKNK